MNFYDNKIYREFVIKLTGSLDLGPALIDLREYLKKFMPLDEIILFRFDDDNRNIHQVFRVNGDGLLGEPNQLLVMLNKDERILDINKRFLLGGKTMDTPLPLIMSAGLKDTNLKDAIEKLDIPESSDIVILYEPDLKSGLVAVSHQKNAYTESHLSLFRMLRDLFCIAMTNALRYAKVQKKRDDLQDDNTVFREVTVRLTGEQDIGKAFINVLRYLKDLIPLGEIALLRLSDTNTGQRILLRVNENGTIGEPGTLSCVLGEDRQILERFPDTFVAPIADGGFNIDKKEIKQKLFELGLDIDTSVIAIGVQSMHAAVLFISKKNETFSERHLSMLNMLKEPFVIAIHNAVRFYEIEYLKNRLEEENRELHVDMQREIGDRVIGMHHGLKQVMALATRVSKTPSPVLLLGETGSGKEVIARTIHRMSDRSTGPFIAINCGAIPESLVDSELFGHEKGSFTGALEMKRGRFERAEKGTIFLDEVGELPLSAQVKLLRVLQEREYERVGGSQTMHADVRLIAATNRDLLTMMRKGLFREDLWFRLNVFPIKVPPLRERREDIPLLAYHFIAVKSAQLNLAYRPSLSSDALEKLVAYDWPGNVREMQNAIERALILSHGEPLQFPYLEALSNTETDMFLSDPIDKTEIQCRKFRIPSFEEAVKSYLKLVLEASGGRVGGINGAAIRAGINPSTFRSKLRKYGIKMNEQIEILTAIDPQRRIL